MSVLEAGGSHALEPAGSRGNAATRSAPIWALYCVWLMGVLLGPDLSQAKGRPTAIPRRVNVPLTALARVAGTVLDSESELPVSNATVRIVTLSSGTSVSARTDERGAFEVEVRNLAGTDALDIVADHANYAPLALPNVPANGPHRILLQRRGSVVGLARYADGTPAIGARVLLAGSDLWPPLETRADAAGRWAFHPPADGVYEARANTATHVSSTSERLSVATTTPLPGVDSADAETRNVIVLLPGQTVRGSVVDRFTSQPIEATIRIAPTAGSMLSFEGVAGENGEWEIGPVPKEPLAVSATAVGYVASATAWVRGSNARVPLEPLRIVLAPSLTLRGRAVDSAGRPVPHALVDVESEFNATLAEGTASAHVGELGVTRGAVPPIPRIPSQNSLAASLVAVGSVMASGATDPQGRFAIEGVASGRLRVAVHARKRPSAYSNWFEARSGVVTNELVIVVPDAGIVRGVVKDARGFPLSRVRVELSARDFPFPRVAVSSAEGVYVFEALTGHVSLRAALAGAVAEASADVIPNGEVNIDLTLAGEGHDLYGRAMDSRGFPVANATIRALTMTYSDAQPFDVSATSAADGTFVLRNAPHRDLSIVAEHRSFASGRAHAGMPWPRELRVILTEGRTVSGRVRASDTGASIGGAPVRLVATSDVHDTRTSSDGLFRFERVVSGDARLTVAHPDHEEASRAFSVSDRDVVVDVVQLDPVGTISGSVEDRLGTPVPHAAVQASSGQNTRTATTDASGRFLVRLPPGIYEVRAAHTAAGSASARSRVRVSARSEEGGVWIRLPQRID